MDILLVGAGGYGTLYVDELLQHNDPDMHWVGVVDPFLDNAARKEEILAAGIPVYPSMEDFYREHKADLTCIATPPYLHEQQCLCALAHGSAVMCEKPAAPTPEQVENMMAAEKTYGKFIGIGFQWSYSAAMQALKQDIAAGKMGKPLLLKTAVSWPRNRAYYARGGGWGGKATHKGMPLYDSIASNACAHYLHNMLFVMGDTPTTSATPEKIEGRLLRANNIETFDTCALRLTLPGGVPLLFLASHATETIRDPMFRYEFENAVVTFEQGADCRVVAEFADGSKKEYGDPFKDTMHKIWDCTDALAAGTRPVCTAETALPHIRTIHALHQNFTIENFPAELVRENEETQGVYVEGLFDALYRAFDAGTEKLDI